MLNFILKDHERVYFYFDHTANAPVCVEFVLFIYHFPIEFRNWKLRGEEHFFIERGYVCLQVMFYFLRDTPGEYFFYILEQ